MIFGVKKFNLARWDSMKQNILYFLNLNLK